MSPSKPFVQKKKLLLCLDAFGTLFTPKVPIPVGYARAAARHGIDGIEDTENPREIARRFKKSFSEESAKNPNYGKASGMLVDQWWENVIRGVFNPMLGPTQRFPQGLTKELMRTYSSNAGYTLYKDVKPFFSMLQRAKREAQLQVRTPTHPWPWEKTIVGIITNSDYRVPYILTSLGLNVMNRRYKEPCHTALMEEEETDISFIIMSYDVGIEKPDAAIYKAAEELLGDDIEDYEKLHVGDDVDTDYQGAKDAGWDRVLLLRGEEECRVAGKGVQRIEVENKQGRFKTVDAVNSLLDLDTWQPKQRKRRFVR
ncbi:hydrolase HAD superfamily [Pyrenophora tritici-repentis]|uniref:HAD-hyrolase n=2 Tax=Pyrenophora tritici-repentis TaxID=45151 RepID=A0A2W1EKN4_9PLEO|nr:haloacid dehalogenase [Pyrenophora tritici-repentis Pt-1C-BFP]KAA8615411.1 hydrolase [Pyrenophora tritici-repentis]EDU51558.1 haloacid dehalogenase [Pyrenophora tritici-repentis Pt-1C-BFP]KAF7444015.1 putative hydrolase [Pyrenophora tritici-repentis]KAF7566250.1 hydrolase (HAD superfamily) [Pyrenophora tritici-repentis]KAG9379753.1 putative hydrolase [Pyrenophora tritici-repentis]